MQKKTVAILASFLLLAGCAKSDYLYKSPNKIDSVRIAKASRSEKKGGLNHPYTLGPRQIREILGSLYFNKKVLLRIDVKDRELFQERHIEFLATYLQEAFKKVGPEQVVSVSYFTQSRSFGLMNDRLTIFRAYMKEDGLHFKFSKVYAKLLGDRTTQGKQRATGEARGIGVSLEVQPGQNRISWKPEEIVFDVKRQFAKGETGKKWRGKSADSKKKKVITRRPKRKLTAHERLKELDRLKEEELITEKEYKKKRKVILRDL
jgi:hypothetical protein